MELVRSPNHHMPTADPAAHTANSAMLTPNHLTPNHHMPNHHMPNPHMPKHHMPTAEPVSLAAFRAAKRSHPSFPRS